MKINTTMPKSLRPFFSEELVKYQNAYLGGNLDIAWSHLERAHVIGQAYPYEHSFVHWKMLVFGIKIKSTGEVLGQLPRLLVGGVKSFVGKIPVGNTGGANIPPLRPLPVEQDILNIFRQAGVNVPQ